MGSTTGDALAWLCGADSATAYRLAALAPATQQEDWWEPYSSAVVPDWFGLRLGLEQTPRVRLRTGSPTVRNGTSAPDGSDGEPGTIAWLPRFAAIEEDVMGDQGADILDDVTLEVVDHCDGPVGGACSRALADGVVRCAGHRIDPDDGRPEYVRLQVPAGSRHCPLTFDLEAFGM